MRYTISNYNHAYICMIFTLKGFSMRLLVSSKLKTFVCAILFLGSIGVMTSAHAGLVFEQSSDGASIGAERVSNTSAVNQITPSFSGVVVSGSVGKSFPHRQLLNLEPNPTPLIFQAGVAPKTIPVIAGAGRDVTLVQALKQLVPAGWKVYSDIQLDEHRRFDWSGSRPWNLIFNSLLQDANLRAYVDWSTREVTMIAGEVSKVANQKPFQPAGPMTQVNSEQVLSRQEVDSMLAKINKGTATRPAPLTQNQPIVKPSSGSLNGAGGQQVGIPQSDALVRSTETVSNTPNSIWVMDKELSVKGNLEKWAKSIGWKLVWSARTDDHVYDYSSEAFEGYAFKGELTGSRGVMARVIGTFIDSNPPLRIEFFKPNRIVEVSVYKANAQQSLDSVIQNNSGVIASETSK